MSPKRLAQSIPRDAVKATDHQGKSPSVIVCRPSPSFIPKEYGTPELAAVEMLGDFPVGVNRPYSQPDHAYFTLAEHAFWRDVSCATIEIRNDEIVDESGQEKLALMPAVILRNIQLLPSRRWTTLAGCITDREERSCRKPPFSLSATSIS